MAASKSYKITSDAKFQEWIWNVFKALSFLVFSMFTFYVAQLNSSITSLTAQLRVMENHQVDTDKRVLAIEVSRDINMESYKKVVSDVQDMKTQMVQNTMRLQTIADFVAKHYK